MALALWLAGRLDEELAEGLDVELDVKLAFELEYWKDVPLV